MKKRMRILSSVLAMALLVGSIPTTSFAATNTSADEAEAQKVQLEASEVEGYSRLDELELPKKENQVEPLYQADDMVTVIVEMEEAPVMDYYETSTYAEEAESDATAGEAVSEFLASEEAKEYSEELLAGQDDVISEIYTCLAVITEQQQFQRIERQAEPQEGENFEVTAQWTNVTNAVAVRVPYGSLEDIQNLDGVKRAYVEHVYDRPDPIENADLTNIEGRESNSYDMANVGGAWQEGYTGKGMLVAVLDSGLDIKMDSQGKVVRTHEAFTEDSFFSGNPTDGTDD